MSKANVRKGSDGKWRKWELRWASNLGMIEEDAPALSDGTPQDWRVWVVTGVFNTKAQAYRRTPA